MTLSSASLYFSLTRALLPNVLRFPCTRYTRVYAYVYDFYVYPTCKKIFNTKKQQMLSRNRSNPVLESFKISSLED